VVELAGRSGSSDMSGQAVVPDWAELFDCVDMPDVGKSDQAELFDQVGMLGDVDKSDQADALDLEMLSEESHWGMYGWGLGTQNTQVVEDYIVLWVLTSLGDSVVPVLYQQILQLDTLSVVV
jgi:hypothetical protein